MTGSFVTARAYWVWGFVSGAGKGPVAPGSGEWGVAPCGPQRSDGSHRHEPLPTPHAFSSQHPIHEGDRKSTRLNSSHGYISYAVFCLTKNNTAIASHHP